VWSVIESEKQKVQRGKIMRLAKGEKKERKQEDSIAN
jgi:hypothetical protein